MTAYNFRKNNIAEIDEAIAYATEKGLGIIAMKTMAGVYWDKERTRPMLNIHLIWPGFLTDLALNVLLALLIVLWDLTLKPKFWTLPESGMFRMNF